jgi:hypothetical protein
MKPYHSLVSGLSQIVLDAEKLSRKCYRNPTHINIEGFARYLEGIV